MLSYSNDTIYCWGCGLKRLKMVRLTEENKPTNNISSICQNKHCLLYMDLSKIQSWTHYNAPVAPELTDKMLRDDKRVQKRLDKLTRIPYLG